MIPLFIFQLVAHEIGHILGMWHADAPWRSNFCPKNGLMGIWWNAEKFQDCARKDFKAMYNHYILKAGLEWCLTADFDGFKSKTTDN